MTFLADFSVSKKTQDVLGGFLSIFSTFLNFVKKNQNVSEVFFTFSAHFSMSKKTQDVLGGFSLSFITFFNYVKKTQDN